MINMIRERFPEYDDLSDAELASLLTSKLSQTTGTVNHENLSGPGVVTADTSQELQDHAPDLKPVVKGTKAEVLQMKKSGQISPQKVIFTPPGGIAYIIDPQAVQGIYGGSVADAVKQARNDLAEGGNKESRLLGYPKREGIQPGQATNVAVDKDGNVITDLGDMKDAADAQDVVYAAQGEPDDAMQHAMRIAQRMKQGGANG